MGLFGGSSSSSSSLQNSIAFNPIINVGHDNTADNRTKQRGSADAKAEAKDEFGLSAGLALAPGSSASGGPVTGIGDRQPASYPYYMGAGDVQPMAQEKSDNSFFNGPKKINPLYIAVALGGSVILYLMIKKSKKR